MEVDVETGRISVQQTTYIKKILERFEMTDSKPSSIPMNPGVANSLLPSKHQADQDTIKWDPSAIASLVWPAVHTRPDISYLVGVPSRYYANPGPIFFFFSKSIIATPSACRGRYAGFYYFIALLLVLYIIDKCRASITAQAPILSVSGFCPLPDTCGVLVNACGPKLVDQSE